jgi:hypothetical protein
MSLLCIILCRRQAVTVLIVLKPACQKTTIRSRVVVSRGTVERRITGVRRRSLEAWDARRAVNLIGRSRRGEVVRKRIRSFGGVFRGQSLILWFGCDIFR